MSRMTDNHFSYKPNPAGHNEKKSEKELHQSDDIKVLRDAALIFLDTVRNSSVHNAAPFAEKALESINPALLSNENLNAIILSFAEYPIFMRNFGYFLSAAYNRSANSEFVLENFYEEILWGVGFNLNSNAKLLVRGDTGYDVGFDSKGLIINYGNGGALGHSSKCNILINYGLLSHMGEGLLNNSILINYGDISGFIGAKFVNDALLIANCGKVGHCIMTDRTVDFGVIIDKSYSNGNRYISSSIFPDNMVSELKEYLFELKPLLAPVRSNEEIFSELRRRDIRKEITDIINEVKK